MTLATIQQAAGTISSGFGLFNSSDPRKDAERNARSDQLYQAARLGDDQAARDLACRASNDAARTTYPASCGASGVSGWGSVAARQYAAGLVARLAAEGVSINLATGQVSRTVSSRIAGQLVPGNPAPVVNPMGPPLATVGTAGVSPLVAVVLVGAALFVLYRYGGR